MAKRSLLLPLLLAEIIFSTVAETWYVAPASLSYNKFQGTAATINVKIRVSRSDSSGLAKNFYLLVTGANLGSYETGSRRLYLNNSLGSEYVAVNLRKPSGTTEISTPNTAGGKTLLTGSIGATVTSVDVAFKVYIPVDYIFTAGTYTNFFTFSLYVGSTTYSASLPASAAGVFNIGVEVTSSGYRGSVALYPASINFGSMQEGQSYTGTANLLVTGVKNFVVYISSANLGKLKQTGSDSEIPYSIVVDSSATSPVTITSFPYTDWIIQLTTSTTDRLYTVVITTETLDFLEAGDYTDTLTFSFTQP
jgi:hypothetical protein